MKKEKSKKMDMDIRVGLTVGELKKFIRSFPNEAIVTIVTTVKPYAQECVGFHQYIMEPTKQKSIWKAVNSEEGGLVGDLSQGKKAALMLGIRHDIPSKFKVRPRHERKTSHDNQ